MEDDNLWHYRSPNRQEYLNAIKELGFIKMRNAFVEEITRVSKKDKKIVILAGDIG